MSFTDEVREAVSDIADASQEAFAEEQARTAAEAEQPPEVFEDTQNQGPQPPAPPTPPAA